MEVNRFGEYIKNFLPTKRSVPQENGVQKVPEVGNTHQATPRVPGAARGVFPSSVAFSAVSYFPNLL